MKKKHHTRETKPIARALAPTTWRATLPLVATLIGCHAEAISPDPVVLAEMEPARPGSNVAIDLAPTPEPKATEPEPVVEQKVKWKPVPRPKPRAWIRPSHKIVDIGGW